MIRSLLIFIFILVVYYAVKILLRSAVKSYHEEDRKRTRIMGEDMVQDPECHTYVPKGRAVTRHTGGRLRYFCSEACANKYGEKNRA